MRALARWLGRLALWLAAALAAGFVVFLIHAARMTAPDEPPQADGIVALTGGGGDRIAAAVALLADGAGERLLITGVNPNVSDAAVRELAAGHDDLFDCCVDMGRSARTTAGNGWESARWAETQGYDSVILVTSDYHMPRSLLELRSAMPGKTVIAYPVRSERTNPATAWRKPRAAWRLFQEYLKFLAVSLRAPFLPDGG